MTLFFLKEWFVIYARAFHNSKNRMHWLKLTPDLLLILCPSQADTPTRAREGPTILVPAPRSAGLRLALAAHACLVGARGKVNLPGALSTPIRPWCSLSAISGQ